MIHLKSVGDDDEKYEKEYPTMRERRRKIFIHLNVTIRKVTHDIT